MTDTRVVVFGSKLLADNWCRRQAFNPQKAILATHPDKLNGFLGEVRVVRFPRDIWHPTTFPDEQRVKETEEMLRTMERLAPGSVRTEEG